MNLFFWIRIKRLHTTVINFKNDICISHKQLVLVAALVFTRANFFFLTSNAFRFKTSHYKIP
ncbi:hypothetical protein EFY79_00795 [Hanamia caeni]|uniref:Uncharacterized protein n=1 Tax=Hanamia caeni TaxID=2294116 RepID=A0A3M9NRQ2_9BACT|nr:hypothetical protein EFY79_00795 [Hanamia caeni]